MDYELKYVITIFLIVKIAALSPEFSISGKKEKLEQKHGSMEASLAEPLGSGETPGFLAGGSHRGPYFIWGPESDKAEQMRVFGVRDDPELEMVKENLKFDLCESKIQSLEGTQKWRNIQKVLHWLNRFLSSNHTSMQLCRKRKNHKPRTSFTNPKIKNYDFYPSMKSFFKRKTPMPEGRWNDVKLSIRSGEEKKIKRKRKYKHKSWGIFSKNETKKLKSKWKGPRHERRNFPNSSPFHLDTSTTSRPNSVLFDSGRVFLKKAKTRNDCLNLNWKSSAVKTGKNCVKTKYSKARQKSELRPAHPKEDWSKEPEARGNEIDRLQKQKTKPWPHFIYHRVSSNFLHPEMAGHSHRQSAYVAISVATSSKPETTDNNV